MDVIALALLPLTLAFIMFALGLSIQTSDFKEIVKFPKAFVIGFLSQLVLLPLVTLTIIFIFKPTPTFAFGFMLLSFCPGGVTSNMLCKFINGNIPLSIALTSIMSLVCIVTVPILTTLSYNYYLASASEQLSLFGMGLKMFLITALPVSIGIFINERARFFTNRHRDKFMLAASIIFIILVVLAIVGNYELLVKNFSQFSIMIISLIFSLFLIGVGISKILRLSWLDAKTIGMEVGIQNSTMAMALAGMIATSSEAVLPEFALPAAVYSVLMYLMAIPYIAIFRKIN